jgi:hypothetical protein
MNNVELKNAADSFAHTRLYQVDGLSHTTDRQGNSPYKYIERERLYKELYVEIVKDAVEKNVVLDKQKVHCSLMPG